MTDSRDREIHLRKLNSSDYLARRFPVDMRSELPLTEHDTERREFIDNTIELYLDQTRQSNSAVNTEQVAKILYEADRDYAVEALKSVFEDLVNLPASIKYVVAQLLARLYDEPGKIETTSLPDGTTEVIGEYLGKAIQLRLSDQFGYQPEACCEIKPWDMYGTMAVFTHSNPSREDKEYGEIVGTFSYHAIKPLLPADRPELASRPSWQGMRHVAAPEYYVTVEPVTTKDLFYRPTSEAAETSAKQAQIQKWFPKNFERLQKNPFFEQCGIPLLALPLKEQVVMYQLLSKYDNVYQVNEAEVEAMANDIAGDINKLRAYTLCFAHTGSLKLITEPTVATLATPYTEHDAQQRNPLETFIDFADRAEKTARQLHSELLAKYPDMDLPVDDIVHGLVVGALHDLGDINNVTAKDVYRETVQQRASEIGLGLSYFREIMGLAEQSGEVDLNQYVLRQEALEKIITNPQVKSIVVRHLVKEKLLKPVPKVSWEVDRNLEACSRRVGFDLKKYLLAKTAAVGRKLTVLELGMGSGMAKADRVQLGGSHEFNVSDAFYYNLGTLCKNVLDFPSLSENIQLPLTESDQKIIGEVLYKLIVIQAGQETNDYFSYNDENLKALTEDPAQLLTLLKQQFPRLAQAAYIPSTISRVDEAGVTFYPNKIHFNTQTPAVRAALQILAKQGDKYIKPDCDVLSEMPFHPAGTIIGDFNVVSKFKPDQCDVIVAARSTVYKYGAAWIALQKQLVKLLRQGSGELIDDSIRDNDGGSYRFAEVMDFINELNDLVVVTGQPFPNEDYRANRVPLAHVIASGKVSRELLRECLQTGAQLEEFTQLVNNEEYLTSLTADGKVAKAVKAKQSSATAN